MGCGASQQAKPGANKPVKKPRSTRREMLEDVFDACDDDGSGALTLAEFAKLFDEKVTLAEEIKSKFDAIDSEQKDGKLSKEEFITYHLQKFKVLDDETFDVICSQLLPKAEAAKVIEDVPAVVGTDATEKADEVQAIKPEPSEPKK